MMGIETIRLENDDVLKASARSKFNRGCCRNLSRKVFFWGITDEVKNDS